VEAFPCQDISVAGKQLGMRNEAVYLDLLDQGYSEEQADEEARTRSGLWFQYKRVIEEIRPRWVVIENVRNLLSNGLATVLKDLNEIGYNAEWEVISARSVGACHLRERVFLVAYPNSSSVWNPERAECRSDGLAVARNIGEERSIEFTDTNSERLEGQRITGRIPKEYAAVDGGVNTSVKKFTYSDDFRFWPAFTSQEEKSKWWTEATFKFSYGWQTEPGVCGVDDGLSKELDKGRAQRIKQLGNSIVPAIVTIIAKRILEIENAKEVF